MDYRDFLKEFKSLYVGIKNEDLKKLYNLDFCLIRYGNDIIMNNRCINRSYLGKRMIPSDIQKINTISANVNVVDSAVLLLCGGKATGFMNTPKAIYKIRNLLEFKDQFSFLGLNVRQVIKAEKSFSCKMPIIIYDDFCNHVRIVNHLKKNKFFGKSPADFYFVRQSTGLRYIPSRKLLVKNNLQDYLSRDELNSLPKKTKLFITKNINDTIISDGHFAFNSLINSTSFRSLLRNNRRIKYLIISNINNLGQKYFSNLIGTNGVENHILVCKRKMGERMDNVFITPKGLIIEPYFTQSKIESNIGFTATSYIRLDDLFYSFGYKSKRHYLATRKNMRVHNKYRLVLKRPVIDGVKATTVHFESSLGESWRFLRFKMIEIKRGQFFPFKSLRDMTPNYIKSLGKAITKYNYI